MFQSVFPAIESLYQLQVFYNIGSYFQKESYFILKN